MAFAFCIAENSYSQVTVPVASLDSLNNLADSLAQRSDSLSFLVDSLMNKNRAEEKATEKKATEKAEKKKADHWDGSAGLGFTVNSGNSEQHTIVTNLSLTRHDDKTRFSSQNTVTKTNGTESNSTDKGSFKNKFEVRLSKRFFYFASADMNYNREAGVDFRLSPGLGAGFLAIDRKEVKLNLNFGANPITEWLKDQDRTTRGHYLFSEEFRAKINGYARVEQNLTFKPRFVEFENYLMSFNVTLTMSLFSNLELQTNIENNYNSRPSSHDPPLQEIGLDVLHIRCFQFLVNHRLKSIISPVIGFQPQERSKW